MRGNDFETTSRTQPLCCAASRKLSASKNTRQAGLNQVDHRLKRLTGVILLMACSTVAALTASCSLGERRIRESAILYLGWDDAERVQLFATSDGGRSSKMLTTTAHGVNDYAIAPDGETIVYSSLASGIGSELWLYQLSSGESTLVLSCAGTNCRAPVWHPDGVQLLYERQTLEPATAAGYPTLWWLNTVNGMTSPLLEDAPAYGQGAAFSPAGDWLSYVSVPEQGVRLYNLASHESHLIPSSVGTPAAWSPDGQSLLTRDRHLVILHGDEGADHQGHTHQYSEGVSIFVTELPAFNSFRLGGDDIADDGPPAWSPDGSLIAFGRKSPRAGDGRQLWLIKPDGSGGRPLTHATQYHHGAIAWSRDGQMLLFQRVDVESIDQKPGIWLMDVDTEQMLEVTTPGFLPAWLQ